MFRQRRCVCVAPTVAQPAANTVTSCTCDTTRRQAGRESQRIVPIKALTSTEPIPGYELQERIGSGGYGEVWRATAPGGLTKAVKFVYGYFDEDRASRELKALERIKEVRHPFLLSLERIEVVEGQLVIVTELADATLKDRCDECKASDQPGIPRDELIEHLRDTADALDFMCERFSLQHLDVKPDNLLLVGGRIKVADFGLVKQLHEATASMMGGLTPLYAAPEVFDGRPSLHSDQYSLAIVYQEMLTGVLPFDGTTPARLATQHLTVEPDVSSLPLSDRAIIARALAKDPDRRFASCRELVDSLLAAPQLAAASESQSQSPPALSHNRLPRTFTNAPPRAGTSPNEVAATKAPSAHRPRAVFETASSAPHFQTLPPIEIESQAAQLRPTLFIGVGETGARALAHLRRRLDDRFGDLGLVPAIEMLLLDTDTAALSLATQREAGRLATEQTVPLPLRRAQHYRNKSAALQSISRRWVYNIPRSQQTEGMRPLGRLAFIDHSSELFERVRQALAAVTAPEAVAASAEQSGLKVAGGSPRVILVSSISGGTGSGMVLDLAFAVRWILGEMGLADDELMGVLLHSTGRNSNQKDLAIVNAYATVTELLHYSRPDQRYPGDAGCGLPAFDSSVAPFNHSYLVHLGDDLLEDEFDAATDGLAEYLYLDVATAGGEFFSLVRRESGTSPPVINVRSFGARRLGCSQLDLRFATERLCRDVIRSWLGSDTDEAPQTIDLLRRNGAGNQPSAVDRGVAHVDADALSEQLARSHKLELAPLAADLRGVVERQFGEPVDAFFKRLLGDETPGADANAGSAINPAEHLETVQKLFGPIKLEDGSPAPLREPWKSEIDKHVARTSKSLAGAIGRFVLELVDEPGARLKGARQSAEWFVKRFRAVREQARQRMGETAAEIGRREAAQLAASPADAGKSAVGQRDKNSRATAPPEQLWFEHFQICLEHLALRGVEKLLFALGRELSTLNDQLRDLGRELTFLADQFAAPRDASADTLGDDQDHVLSVAQLVTEDLQGRVAKLASAVDREFRQSFFGADQGLRSAVSSSGELREKLPPALRRAARQAVLDAQRQTDIAAIIADAKAAAPEEIGEQLRTWREAVTPSLLRCGGAKRLLLAVPEGSDLAALQQVIQAEFDEPVSLATHDDAGAVLCYEVEQLSAVHLVSSLINNRGDYAQAASRVHARGDVQWSF